MLQIELNLKDSLNSILMANLLRVKVVRVHSGLVVEISGSQLDEEQGNAKEKTEKNVYMFSISILNVELVQLMFRSSTDCCVSDW